MGDGGEYYEFSFGHVNWRLALAIHLYMGWIMSHCSCWHSGPPERSSGWRSGVRHSVLWENWQNRPLDSEVFSGEIFYEPGFFHLPRLRKALKLLAKISAPCDQQQPPTKMCAWLHILPLSKSHVCWPLPPPACPLSLWKSFSELRGCFLGNRP